MEAVVIFSEGTWFVTVASVLGNGRFFINLESSIGRGQFSDVMTGRDRSDDTIVLAKRLSFNNIGSYGLRIIEDIEKIMALPHHAHIDTPLWKEMLEDRGCIYINLRYFSEGNLATFTKQANPNLSTKVQIMKEWLRNKRVRLDINASIYKVCPFYNGWN